VTPRDAREKGVDLGDELPVASERRRPIQRADASTLAEPAPSRSAPKLLTLR
jgi:hypothetical protein